MNKSFKTAAALAVLAWAGQASAQITFYEREGFQGRSFVADQAVPNFQNHGFNDQASSVMVGRDQWLVCEDVAFGGRCATLREGRYPSLQAMGLNNRVSSVRRAGGEPDMAPQARRRYDEGDMPGDGRDYGRRRNERLYQARVLSARAVVGPPEQRCWVAREQVVQERGDNRVGAGLAGAVIGGILGHQLGGGTGKDLATVGGAVAGASIGANMGSDGGGRSVGYRNVQRCENMQSSARPAYWEVTYRYRGQEHQVQMSSQPGNTVSVNRDGEPRG
ncbi:MAG: glycine zipper 2TM domain-containing protein [Ramlibacter sp.]|nr:glycine zipper 2TM domain-containing protein [Ramlibacter sp.]